MLCSSSSVWMSSRQCSDVVFEVLLIVGSLCLVVCIILPCMLLLCSGESVCSSSVNVYSCGYQWSWSFDISSSMFGKSMNCMSVDHVMCSSVNMNCGSVIEWLCFINYVGLYISDMYSSFIILLYSSYISLIPSSLLISSSLSYSLSYMSSTTNKLILPVLFSIRFFVYSFDVIHSLGIYSFGIKIDAIPGRFNFTSMIRILIKGEHRG